MTTNFTKSLWVAAALGAGCGSVAPSPDIVDSAIGSPDATSATPDAEITVSERSCAEVLAADPTAGSGAYRIDPDGPGGTAPFDVICAMAFQGGTWTQVTDQLAASLTAGVNRQYLYLYGSSGHISPCTTEVWRWTEGSGQELTGAYMGFGDSSVTTVDCDGSPEVPQWGIGCSNGGGPFSKVLPIYTQAPTGGISEVCITGSCVLAAVIFEKEGC